MDIGGNIKFYRQKAGMKQNEFANLFGLTSTTISKIESGRGVIKMDLLKEIANKLNVPLEKLIFGPDTILLNPDLLQKLKNEQN